MSICIYLGKIRRLRVESPLIRTFFVEGGIYFVVLTRKSFSSALFSLSFKKVVGKDTGAATDLVSRELAILNLGTTHPAGVVIRSTTTATPRRERAVSDDVLVLAHSQQGPEEETLRPSSTGEIELLTDGDDVRPWDEEEDEDSTMTPRQRGDLRSVRPQGQSVMLVEVVSRNDALSEDQSSSRDKIALSRNAESRESELKKVPNASQAIPERFLDEGYGLNRGSRDALSHLSPTPLSTPRFLADSLDQ
ncbi:hypothetical protein BKA70DRAFT_1230814 [Coprinopsis sp. MPI-PUGE-AT-0042]|nr:hypothetical protein BKA70DRAFT_1230814 [Coprinopsis sp. MPI-PUGE-AT-0042]